MSTSTSTSMRRLFAAVLSLFLTFNLNLSTTDGSPVDNHINEQFIRFHIIGIHPNDKYATLNLLESLFDKPTLIADGFSEDSFSAVYENNNVVSNSKVDSKVDGDGDGDGPTDADASKPLYMVTAGSSDIDDITEVDVSALFLDEMLLLDERVAINRIIESYKALFAKKAKSLSDPEKTAAEPTPVRKPLIILFSGSVQAAGKIEPLLNDAWQLFSFDTFGDYSTSSFLTKMDIKVLLVPSRLEKGQSAGIEARDAMREVIKTAATKSVGTVDPLIASFFNTLTPAPTFSMPLTYEPLTSLGEGIEDCTAASAVAYSWALKAANASVTRLNKYTDPLEFSGYMENLVNGAIKIFEDEIIKSNRKSNSNSNSYSNSTPSAAGVKLFQKDLSNKIYEKMLPFYKRQIQLTRNEIAAKFNKAIADDVEISTNIMVDINRVKSKMLKEYSSHIHKLTPKGAPPTTWNGQYELYDFDLTLSEYIAGREAHYQCLGVLKYKRKPIDLSFHALVAHPLGLRDYRQDPLGRNGDEFFFDQSKAAALSEQNVKPGLARRVLKQSIMEMEAQRVQTRAPGVSMSTLKQKSEFAREMLMFPLSVKNPNVPFQGSGKRGRRRRQQASEGGPPARDKTRLELGPERFVRWDIEPMGEVQKALDRLAVRAAEGGAETGESLRPVARQLNSLKSALNKIPLAGNQYFTQPPLNYQAKGGGKASSS